MKEEGQERFLKNIIPAVYESDSHEYITYLSHTTEEGCCRPDSPRLLKVLPMLCVNMPLRRWEEIIEQMDHLTLQDLEN